METAVILAAGRGTRMGALTRDAEAAARGRGRPLIEHVLRGVAAAGVRRAMVVVGHLGEQIEEALGDGERLGLAITYCRQERADGTARALLLAANALGDGAVPRQLGRHPRAARRSTREFVAGLRGAALRRAAGGQRGGRSVARRRGVRRRRSGASRRLEEKPPRGTSTTRWNNAGILVLTRRVFDYARRLAPSTRGEYELPQAIGAMVRRRLRSCARMPVRGSGRDVGTPEDLAAARDAGFAPAGGRTTEPRRERSARNWRRAKVGGERTDLLVRAIRGSTSGARRRSWCAPRARQPHRRAHRLQRPAGLADGHRPQRARSPAPRATIGACSWPTRDPALPGAPLSDCEPESAASPPAIGATTTRRRRKGCCRRSDPRRCAAAISWSTATFRPAPASLRPRPWSSPARWRCWRSTTRSCRPASWPSWRRRRSGTSARRAAAWTRRFVCWLRPATRCASTSIRCARGRLPLRPGYALVVCHSLVEAEKSGAARAAYNHRVVECRLACRVLERAAGRQPAAPARPPAASCAVCSPIARSPISPRFSRTLCRRDRCGWPRSPSSIGTADEPLVGAGGCDRRRARDVLPGAPRAARVHRGRAGRPAPRRRCAAAIGSAFSALMDASHASCRDDYEISSPVLEDAGRRGQASGRASARA